MSSCVTAMDDANDSENQQMLAGIMDNLDADYFDFNNVNDRLRRYVKAR